MVMHITFLNLRGEHPIEFDVDRLEITSGSVEGYRTLRDTNVREGGSREDGSVEAQVFYAGLDCEGFHLTPPTVEQRTRRHQMNVAEKKESEVA